MKDTTSSRRFLIEGVLFLAYAAFGVSWLAVAPLAADLIQAFGVTATQFSQLNLAVTLPKVFLPVITGWAAVHFGIKNSLSLALLLICAVGVGPLVPAFGVVLASRFVFGMGGAMLVTLMAPMVMQWFPKRELPLVNALNGVAVNTGIAFTMNVTAPLSSTSLGWRGTMGVYAVVHLLVLLAWTAFGRENVAPLPVATGAAPAPPAVVRYMDVWARKETWLATLAFTAAVALYLSFSLWLPKFYLEQPELHFSKAMASRYSGIINLAGIPSAIVCGLLTQRLGVRRPFLIVGGLLSGTVAFGMFLFPSPAIIMASAVLLGVSLFIPTAAITTSLMELPGVTPRHVSLMMGTMFSVCYTLSSLAPTLVGYLRDRTGSFVPGFTALTVFSWAIFISGLFWRETGPGARLAPRGA